MREKIKTIVKLEQINVDWDFIRLIKGRKLVCCQYKGYRIPMMVPIQMKAKLNTFYQAMMKYADYCDKINKMCQVIEHQGVHSSSQASSWQSMKKLG